MRFPVPTYVGTPEQHPPLFPREPSPSKAAALLPPVSGTVRPDDPTPGSTSRLIPRSTQAAFHYNSLSPDPHIFLIAAFLRHIPAPRQNKQASSHPRTKMLSQYFHAQVHFSDCPSRQAHDLKIRPHLLSFSDVPDTVFRLRNSLR